MRHEDGGEPGEGGEPYDSGRLARLFIGSFRFSQGRPALQRQILAHLVGRHGPRMRRELLPEAAEQATGTLLRVVANHRLHGPVTEAEARELIGIQLAALDRLLATAAPSPVDPLQVGIGMAEADLDYLGRPRGRPRVGEVDTGGSSWVDRWTGLLAFHAVLGRSAGLAEFDAMFAEIAEALRTAPELPPAVRIAVDRHFELHPEDRGAGQGAGRSPGDAIVFRQSAPRHRNLGEGVMPDAGPYLAGLRLRGRRVVVVGGGRLAQRRLPRLIEAGADITVISPSVTSSIEGLVRLGEITWTPRGYRTGDLDGAWYVLAATDDPAVNGRVADDAEMAQVFCVRGDDALGGSAFTPAVGRHHGAIVGVLGGGSPRHTAKLRDSIVLGLRTGSYVDLRESGRFAGVALVGGGPGDPGLITMRGRQLLAAADVVIADRLAPQALLEELSPDAEIVDATKLPRGRALAQEEINRLLVEHAGAGKAVVRLKGGDSFVFGRGMEEMLACAKAGVPCIVVPGVSSAIGVPAMAGIPVTHRAVSHEFTVLSGHVRPDDPRSLIDWAALARLRGTLVLLMAVDNIPAIAATLIRYGRDESTPAGAVQEGTTTHQRVVTSTLGRLAEDMTAAAIQPPAIIVIGDVVRFSAPQTARTVAGAP